MHRQADDRILRRFESESNLNSSIENGNQFTSMHNFNQSTHNHLRQRSKTREQLTEAETIRSDEERLKKAQKAYEEIMRSLSTTRCHSHLPSEKKSEARNQDHISKPDFGRKRENYEGIRSDIQAFSEMAHHSDSQSQNAFNMRKTKVSKSQRQEFSSDLRKIAEIPDIAFEDLERKSSKFNSSPRVARHSSLSVKAVKSLQHALKPVRLEHPSWVQNQLGNSYEGENKDSRTTASEDFLRDERSRGRPTGKPISTLESIVSDQQEESNPRNFINDIWSGYQLKYPRGKLGSPKWQLKSPNLKLTKPESSHPSKSQDFLISVRKEVEQSDSEIEELEQKLNKKMLLKQKKENLSKPELNRSRDRTRGNFDFPRNAELGTEFRDMTGGNEATDAKSDSTWNIESQQSAWDDLDDDNFVQRSSRLARPSQYPENESFQRQLQQTTKAKPKKLLQPSQTQASRLRGRSLERYLAEKMERDVSDLTEMKNQFRANPLPAWIKQPKYEKLVGEANETKKRRQRRAKEMLERVQPFAFSKIPNREEGKRRRVFSSLPSTGNGWSKKNNDALKVKSHPESAVSKARAEKVLFIPARFSETRHACVRHFPKDPTFRPAIISSVPDFSRLHAKMDQKRKSVESRSTWLTVPRPFELTATQSMKKENKTEQKLVARKTEDLKKLNRSKLTEKKFDEIVKPTRAFSMMTQFSRQRMEKDRDDDHSSTPNKKIDMSRFRESLNFHSEELADITNNKFTVKIQRAKEMEKNSRDYFDYLEQIRRRLDDRPFLWEQTLMENRRTQIDARFEEILQEFQMKDILDRYTNTSSKQLDLKKAKDNRRS